MHNPQWANEGEFDWSVLPLVEAGEKLLAAGSIVLEFEKVCEVAEVWINGIQASVL